MKQKKKIKGGFHAPEYKNTLDCKTIPMEVPDIVEIPMLMHIGAPCSPLVKKGDRVLQGQKIGDTDKFVSAPIHSSVSGVVKSVVKRLFPNGMEVDAVIIEAEKTMEIHEDVKPPAVSSREDFIKAVRESGLVGLGGAGFPAHVKLNPPKDKKIDTLIINTAECEPYITSDYRETIEETQHVIDGIKTTMEFLGIDKVIIGVEDNKPLTIKLFSEKLDTDKIKVVSLKSRYPQGAEKMLIYALTGRKVPAGGLPSEVGVVVMNVASISFISRYLKTGMPLIKKRVTLDGKALNNPGNYEVYIGTSVKDVIQLSGGFKADPYKILMGGPMMGVALQSTDMPLLKQNNAILVFDKEQSGIPSEKPCIRCSKCVNACPMSLMPLMLNQFALNSDTENLQKYYVNNCMECGSCSYVCPAKRHLVQSIRTGKAMLRKKGSN